MSDPRDRSNDPPVDADAFHQWVAHTADARDIPEDELLNQLVSAFWVLDEMNGLVADEDPFGSPPGDTPPGSSPTVPPARDPADDTADPNTRPAADAAEDDDSDGTADADRSRSEESAVREIRELRDSLHTQLEMVQAVGELRRQVSDISLDVEKQRSRQNDFTDRISDELTRLHGRIEAVDSDGSAAVDDELRDRLQRIDSRLQRMDSRVDEIDSRVDDLDARDDEFDAAIESLESTHQEFETWIDQEFDAIEQLFERYMGTTDELDDRIEAVEGELHDRSTDDQDQLARIRREALQAGIDTGRCETCDARIDVSLLDDPRCPSCDSTLSGVESNDASWNPFSKPTIRTAPRSPERQS